MRVNLATDTLSSGGSVSGTITHCWATSVTNELFCAVRRSGGIFSLHRSTNAGNTFTQVLDLGVSEVSIQHRGFTEALLNGERTYLLGEYNVNSSRVNGGKNDSVTLWQSTNGTTWTPLYIWNFGVHNTRHIHAVTQDPETGRVYISLGDGSIERGIIGWDGNAAWPPNGTHLEQFKTRPGFVAITKQFRTMVTDMLFPGDGDMYAGQEQTIALGIHDAEKGIWRFSPNLRTTTRVLPFAGSGIRLGVVTDSGRQVWADAGNIRTPSGPGIQLFVSNPDQYGTGQWTIQKAVVLSSAKKTVPAGLTTWNDKVFLAIGQTTHIFE